jgi:hypothetical protein
MNINLETILGLEFVGEEIDLFVSVLQKVSDAHKPDESIGFKSKNKKAIEFTNEELTLVNTIYENFKPVEENPPEE